MGDEGIETPGTEHRRVEWMVPRGECETKGGFSGWKRLECVCRWGKGPDKGTVQGTETRRSKVPEQVEWALAY